MILRMRILLSKIGLIIGLFFPIFMLGKNISMDTSDVVLKQIDKAKIENYQLDRDFLYDRVPPPAEDWWEAFKRMFWEWFSEMFEQSGISFAWDYLKWIFLAAIIVFIVLRIFKTNLRGLFQSKSATNKVHFITEDEDIHDINFDDKITKSIEQKNYKEAIRLSYLRILKQLTDKELIAWKVDKTNLDYVLEIKNKSLKGEFEKTSILFEYIWYGEFELGESTFNEAFIEFNKLTKKLTD